MNKIMSDAHFNYKKNGINYYNKKEEDEMVNAN
jgi:hypothetical protein